MSLSERVSLHLYGNLGQTALLNGFKHGLGYEAREFGFQHTHGGVHRGLRNLSYRTYDPETLSVVKEEQKAADAFLYAPSGKVKRVEIKTRITGDLNDHFLNNYYMTEMQEIFSIHNSTRIIYLDLKNRTLPSISGLLPLDEQNQYENWYRPWSWIEGIHDEQSFDEWFNRYIYDACLLCSEKILSFKENSINDLKIYE